MAFIPGENSNYVLPVNEYVPGTEQFGEDFTGAEFHETRTLLADGGDRYGVSTATFDTVEDLMWMGNQGVHKMFHVLIYLVAINHTLC